MTNLDARLTAVYPACPAAIPDLQVEAGSYLVRFARTLEDLDRVLRLRYEIFNVELGEGLDESHATGRDEDELDARFHHLMIQRRDSAAVVGTYRMQTAEMARAPGGFYADPEFDLSTLRTGIMAGAPCPVELMRNVQAKMNLREITIACGMTETSPLSTQTAVDDPLDKRVETVGRPLASSLKSSGWAHTSAL